MPAIKKIHLNPFDKDESSELLEKVRCGDKISDEKSEELCEICSGISLVLHTLISSQEDLLGLLEHFAKSPPEERTNLLWKMKTVPKEKKYRSLPRCLLPKTHTPSTTDLTTFVSLPGFVYSR